MKILSLFLVASLFAGCSVSEPDSDRRLSLTDDGAILGESGQFKVNAVWSEKLIAGEMARAGNKVTLTFASSNDLAVKELTLSAEGFKPFMPTMGHGNHDSNHQVSIDGNVVEVSNIYFNMGSMENHNWVVLLDAVLDGAAESFTIPVPSVAMSGDHGDHGDHGDMELVASKNNMFYVAAEWAENLKSSSDHRDGNTVVLRFFADKEGSKAEEVGFDVDDFVPYMPTMGHGNFDSNHEINFSKDHTYEVEVRNILFIMPNVDDHEWVIRLQATVNGMVDDVVIPVPVVTSGN